MLHLPYNTISKQTFYLKYSTSSATNINDKKKKTKKNYSCGLTLKKYFKTYPKAKCRRMWITKPILMNTLESEKIKMLCFDISHNSLIQWDERGRFFFFRFRHLESAIAFLEIKISQVIQNQRSNRCFQSQLM